MNEKSLEVLKNYDLKVERTVRGRGGLILYTDHGVKLFLECIKQNKYYEKEDYITKAVTESGFKYTDTYMHNMEGRIITESEDGRRYYLKDWFDARECCVAQNKEVCKAVNTLANLHLVLNDVSDAYDKEKLFGSNIKSDDDMKNMYFRHMKELRYAANYIRNKKKKNSFEQLIMKNIEYFYEEASKAVKKMQESTFANKLEKVKNKNEICHGSYNYHNVLFGSNFTAVTNFDHYKNECQLYDLYQFLRKILEKYDWNIVLAYELIDEYNKVKHLDDEDMEFLHILFMFPEKFWKIINSYMNSSKVWVPPKMVEKLDKVIEQNRQRNSFIKTIQN